MSDTITKLTSAGLFIARFEGECIKVSIPARNDAEWVNKFEFLDLPFMDLDTFQAFKDAMVDFMAEFDERKGKLAFGEFPVKKEVENYLAKEKARRC